MDQGKGVQMNLDTILMHLLNRFRWFRELGKRPHIPVILPPEPEPIVFPHTVDYVAGDMEPIVTEPEPVHDALRPNRGGVKKGYIRGPYDMETGKLKLEIADIAEMVLERFENFNPRRIVGHDQSRDLDLVEELLGNDF